MWIRTTISCLALASAAYADASLSSSLGLSPQKVSVHAGSARAQVGASLGGTFSALPPCDLPRCLHPAWLLFHQGQIAEALSQMESFNSNQDKLVANAAQHWSQDFRERALQKLSRAKNLAEDGHFARAERRYRDLSESFEGDLALERELHVLRKLLSSIQRERNAERELSRLEFRLYEVGAQAVILEDLKRFTLQFNGTEAAHRAQELLDAAKTV